MIFFILNKRYPLTQASSPKPLPLIQQGFRERYVTNLSTPTLLLTLLILSFGR